MAEAHCPITQEEKERRERKSGFSIRISGG